MIDGMEAILAQIRDAPRHVTEWQFINATGQDARSPRSVEAHGHEERDEDGHLVGTRLSVRFLMSGGSLVSSTSSSSSVLMSDSGSDIFRSYTITVYVPTTETGTYASDEIVDSIKFAALGHSWVPPTVRERQYR